jgi:hypothetical protein
MPLARLFLGAIMKSTIPGGQNRQNREAGVSPALGKRAVNGDEPTIRHRRNVTASEGVGRR